MKYIIIILHLCLISFILFNCQGSQSPLSKEFEFIVAEKIVPEKEVPRNWNSTFYQQDSNWKGGSRILAADSVVNILQQTTLPLSDMWFPYSECECLIMLLSGSDVIIKLTIPDTNIYQYGFRNHDSFPIACVKEWKHYKFIKIMK